MVLAARICRLQAETFFTGENNRFIGGKDPSIGERVTEKRTRTVNLKIT